MIRVKVLRVTELVGYVHTIRQTIRLMFIFLSHTPLQDAITHNDRLIKNQATFSWTAPDTFSGPVHFM